MVGILDYLDIESVLDIGSGTGRVIHYLKRRCPTIRIRGIEPVSELRQIAYEQGISQNELIDGDATNLLNFKDKVFDLVCAFGVLHHIRNPERAVSEMLRVAKTAVFISDANSFGQGNSFQRTIKQCFNSLGLLRVVNWLRTRGRGYAISESDGLAYPYSIFSNYFQIRRQCHSVHIINTTAAGRNLYRTASHLAMLGIKK